MKLSISLKDLPEVSFAEKDINKILNDMITEYEKAYLESTGERKKLYPGDPIRIFLYSQALRELQLRVMVDDAAKQNLLKYARDGNLDSLGAFTRTDRLDSGYAKVKVKFTLSKVRTRDEIIPKGTRISPDDEIYFAVDFDSVVLAGELSKEVHATCISRGTVGNNFTPGQINILVDPLPWIESIENVETSQGGSDVEDDDNYRERIHLAPEGFSVAGPDGAYEYFAKGYSSLIEDIKVVSPTPGVVDIRVLLEDGELPGLSFIEGLKNHLSAKDKRPLTDKVEVYAPDEVQYNLDLTYYISTKNTDNEEGIKTKVEIAINDYIKWQRAKIGRDINPSELITKIRMAGAKRVDITSPVFTVVGGVEVATIGTKTINYGGLEDE